MFMPISHDNLRRFVQQRASPHDPAAGDYPAKALSGMVRTTRHSAVYSMHSYHQGKKPHDAIRQYIRHFSRPGELVLDPFCGSGGTALAAMLEGRTAIALDRSPAAVFIAQNYCTAIDPDEVQIAARESDDRRAAGTGLALRNPLRPLRRPGPDGPCRLQRAVLLPALPADGAVGRLSAGADRNRRRRLPARIVLRRAMPKPSARRGPRSGGGAGAGRLSLPGRLPAGRGRAATRRLGCEETGILRPL